MIRIAAPNPMKIIVVIVSVPNLIHLSGLSCNLMLHYHHLALVTLFDLIFDLLDRLGFIIDGDVAQFIELSLQRNILFAHLPNRAL